MSDEKTPEPETQSDEELPRFNGGYYSVGRGYAYTRSEIGKHTSDYIGGERVLLADAYKQPKGLKVFDLKDEYSGTLDTLFRF